MNREPSSEQSLHPPFRQEPEVLETPRLLWIAAITLVIFTAGCLWATWIWIARTKDMNPQGSAIPSELGKREIGIVDQVPFAQMNDPALLREKKQAQLRSVGFVDEKKGLIHLPVERGYELVIAEQKGRGP